MKSEWCDDEVDPRTGKRLSVMPSQQWQQWYERRLEALCRIRRSKDAWTRVAVDFLHGRNDSEHVSAALAELTAARAELADLDAQDEADEHA
jgi:hypothetical protein